MAVHLDTTFALQTLVPGSRADSMLREWIATDEELVMSAVAWAEFLCGRWRPMTFASWPA